MISFSLHTGKGISTSTKFLIEGKRHPKISTVVSRIINIIQQLESTGKYADHLEQILNLARSRSIVDKVVYEIICSSKSKSNYSILSITTDSGETRILNLKLISKILYK